MRADVFRVPAPLPLCRRWSTLDLSHLTLTERGRAQERTPGSERAVAARARAKAETSARAYARVGTWRRLRAPCSRRVPGLRLGCHGSVRRRRALAGRLLSRDRHGAPRPRPAPPLCEDRAHRRRQIQTLGFAPNSAVRLRPTAPPARRSHSWRAIVATRPEPAMPMATRRLSGLVARDGSADVRLRLSSAAICRHVPGPTFRRYRRIAGDLYRRRALLRARGMYVRPDVKSRGHSLTVEIARSGVMDPVSRPALPAAASS
jgi:hypothetical protein